MFGGQSAILYDDADDLVTLRYEDRDRFTAFLQDHCAWMFKVRENSDDGDMLKSS